MLGLSSGLHPEQIQLFLIDRKNDIEVIDGGRGRILFQELFEGSA